MGKYSPISRPTSRELRERQSEGLARQGLSSQTFRGTARTTEEAHDIQRRLEREGEAFDRVWAVDNASPDAKQADRDLLLKAKIDPETGGFLHSASTRHE